MRELDELEFHPALRYFPAPAPPIGYQRDEAMALVPLVLSQPSPVERWLGCGTSPTAILTVPNTVTETQLRELREYFLTSPTRGRIITS